MKEDFIIEKRGRKYIDMTKIIPEKTDNGREIIVEIEEKKLINYTPHPGRRKGTGSKKITINRYIKLDDLFFEGLGLWEGEGAKTKGLYFGNSCLDLISHFLKFVELRLGVQKRKFMTTVNISDPTLSRNEIRELVSQKIDIPSKNFTRMCVDSGLRNNYIQVYLNGIILVNIMKNLHTKLKEIMLQEINFSTPYLRGIFAAEGSVLLKKWGTLAHLDFSSKDPEYIEFLRNLLLRVKIKSGDFIVESRKFQIYGKENFEKFGEYGLHTLHPDKLEKFKRGMRNYRRNIESRYMMMCKIIDQIARKPRTYDDLAEKLKKGRTTIQSHYIPILIDKGFAKKVGKRGQALLFQATKSGIKFLIFG